MVHEYSILLTASPAATERKTMSRPSTPTLGGLLAPQPAPIPPGNSQNSQGSIALRAMRSVRSLARIGSWNQLKNFEDKESSGVKDGSGEGKEKGSKEKESKDKSEKKKKKKDKERGASVRGSTSSFEAGALTASHEPTSLRAKKKHSILGLGLPSSMRIQTARNGSTASATSSVPSPSFAFAFSGGQMMMTGTGITPSGNIDKNRLSVESANRLSVEGPPRRAGAAHVVGRGRAGSVMSTASSLRPMSTTSCTSGASSGSSAAASVKWNEEVLESVKEQRRRERADRRRQREKEIEEGGDASGSKTMREKESKRSSDGRRRIPLSEIFPDTAATIAPTSKSSAAPESTRPASSSSSMFDIGVTGPVGSRRYTPPILTVERATADGHSPPNDDELGGGSEGETSGDHSDEVEVGRGLPVTAAFADMEGIEQVQTPMKIRRSRPMSEQLLGGTRPRPMHESDDGTCFLYSMTDRPYADLGVSCQFFFSGVLSILDAATNDLAQLINNLDLEATPTTPDLSPLQPGSPSSVEKDRSQTRSLSGGTARRLFSLSESPLKGQGLRTTTLSTSSLRPYGQSHSRPAGSNVNLQAGSCATTSATNSVSIRTKLNPIGVLGQQIAPWPNSPSKSARVEPNSEPSSCIKTTTPSVTPTSNAVSVTTNDTPTTGASTFRRGHKRTMTPAPEPEPTPIFHPLKPAAKPRPVGIVGTLKARYSCSPSSTASSPQRVDGTIRAPSSMTFGDSPSSSRLRGEGDDDASLGVPNSSPVFKRAVSAGIRKRASFLIPPAATVGSVDGGSGAVKSSPAGGPRERDCILGKDNKDRDSLPIPVETKRVLGMGGTMGGSDVSVYRSGIQLDATDPDADVPEKLRVILGGYREVPKGNKIPYCVEEEEEVPMEVEMGESEMLDDTFSYHDSISPPSPGFSLFHPSLSMPGRSKFPTQNPKLDLVELPRFHFVNTDSQLQGPNEVDIDADVTESLCTEEGDTKKSFDFTGELKKLNESGGSERKSFVEQLENAFKTPAKVDLKLFNKGGKSVGTGIGKDGVLTLEVPPVPVPKLPLGLRKTLSSRTNTSMSVDSGNGNSIISEGNSSGEVPLGGLTGEQIVDVKEPTMWNMTTTETLGTQSDGSNLDRGNGGSNNSNSASISRILDMKEPTLLQGSDSLASDDGHSSGCGLASGDVEDQRRLRDAPSSSSKGSIPSPGQLNKGFKFGGRAKGGQQPAQEKKPFTLSDIIPPPSHDSQSYSDGSSSSLMYEDDSILKSIFAKIKNVPTEEQPPQRRSRVYSDASSRRRTRASVYGHSRQSSEASFSGFESFEEVRRGFEFNVNNPGFYPPPGATSRRRAYHGRQDSVFSIASVSSLGRVINPGVPDPFDYGLPSLVERPSSEDLSFTMSMSVDDTFSFLDHGSRRRRVESDASSFYFRAPARQQQSMQSFTRGHRHRDSNMSNTSFAPPISLYNRSFNHHRRSESNTSTGSFSQFHFGGRRARHRQDASVDSTMSDFSAMRLGRPGLGDKMFDTAEDRGMPLTSISASPPEDVSEGCGPSQDLRYRSSFDSILDERRSLSDSLFEKTGDGDGTSVSSDSVFGYDDSQRAAMMRNGRFLLPPNQFRPLSMTSMMSHHSPKKDDDTMISVRFPLQQAPNFELTFNYSCRLQMLGGGHVRRRSIVSVIDASPCVRVEKRKHSVVQPPNGGYGESPNKARILEKPSIASTISSKFGGERMIKAQHGLLERQSLEDSCLIADGEDISGSCKYLAS